jgi:single-stranded-DNA-specific exonuclease
MIPVREWRLRSPPGKALDLVQRSPAARELPPLVQRLLAVRRLDDESAIEAFLSPRLNQLTDPFRLPDMDLAVERLWRAVDQRESVVLYGDYDVDGVSSLALLHRFLHACGLDTHTFLPHRMDEGYGLNEDALARCLAESRPSLLVAVDCGTTSIREVDRLNATGIDVIVLDHHEVSPDGVPDCVAVVNPKRATGLPCLCTGGLAFKLGHAMLKVRRIDYDIRDVIDLAALATVADAVPLVGENRLLAAKGLEQLARSRHPGLRALLGISGVRHVPRAADISYRLAPRLNAAGRLDTAQAALDLLLADESTPAESLARRLDEQNRERQSLQNRVEIEAETRLRESGDPTEDSVIVLGSPDWHAGVVGIVAGRLVRRYHRPSFVVAFDPGGVGKGSGRSVSGVSLVAAINECRDCIERGGGHEMAVGVTVRRERFDEFRRRVSDAVRRQVGEGGFTPRLELDAEARLDELGAHMLPAYERLEPFGVENESPLLLVRRVMPDGDPLVLKDRHRRLTFAQNGGPRARAIWFDSAHRTLPPPPWDVALGIQRSEFRGTVTADLHVCDIRTAS